jgi:hypothetical protein
MYPSGWDRQGVGAASDANPGCGRSGAHSGSLVSSAGVIQLGNVSYGCSVAAALSSSQVSR